MFQEAVLKGSVHEREFALDIRWEKTGTAKPVILFIHGFKGFKDWGTFNLISREFARRNFVFVKLNFSHNGVTPDNPLEFVDLNAFANNTLSRELQDMDDALQFIKSGAFPVPQEEIDQDNISLVGHSRGGSVSYIKARHDSRIRRVAGWGSPCDLENRWPESMLIEWKEKGVYYLPNTRTGQLMPLNYSIVEDYQANQAHFHIPTALREMEKPVLHVHGDQDETVYLPEVKMILKDIPQIQFEILGGASHVFGGSHPYEGDELPEHTRELIDLTEQFLRN